jgi:hypothetical protein
VGPGDFDETCFDQGLPLQDQGIHVVHHDKTSISRFTGALCLVVFFLVFKKRLGFAGLIQRA